MFYYIELRDIFTWDTEIIQVVNYAYEICPSIY